MPKIVRGPSMAAYIGSIVLAGLAAPLWPPLAAAAPQDYRFELAAPPSKSGTITLVKVRLVHVPEGKPVSGAVIYQSKLDMGPEGMAEMGAPIKTVPSTDPGTYTFEAQPSMSGNWGLSLSARVQGEAQPVRGIVTVAVPK